MIIGAQRAGTTSLAMYLSLHPAIEMAYTPEPVYFIQDSPIIRFIIDGKMLVTSKAYHNLKMMVWRKGYQKEPAYFSRIYELVEIEKYWNLFSDEVINFDASACYFDCPMTPARIKEVLPDCKFIVLLRNPADRAWSHYWHEVVANQSESLPFEEAIHREYIPEEAYFYGYLQRGHYAEHIKRWLEFFPTENFRVYFSEVFFKNPEAVYIDVQKWLGAEPLVALHEYEIWTSVKRKRPVMPDETRKMLDEYYRPHDEALVQLLKDKPEMFGVNGDRNQTENHAGCGMR